MAECPDHADGEKTDPTNKGASDPSVTPETATGIDATPGGDLHKNLPIVLSPKLGAGED